MLLLKHFTIEDFKNTFPLAAFGARVCYSDMNLEQLLKDPLVIDKKRRAEFLSRLANDKHFSVFSHSFVYKEVGVIDAMYIGATYFKSRYNPKYPEVIGISLRHYLEELQKYDPEQYKEAFNKLAEFDTPIECKFSHTINFINRPKQSVKVYLLHFNQFYDGYAVFYIDNISRVATHQLVRHSALNFSQRSQRYVKEDENFVIYPHDIFSKDELPKKASYYSGLSKRFYKELVYKHKLKREDARYFLPEGTRTSIVVSGTLNWFKDFIDKRNTPHAQWEIREVAGMIAEIGDYYVQHIL
jgi:thymidylate synthase (FAD)